VSSAWWVAAPCAPAAPVSLLVQPVGWIVGLAAVSPPTGAYPRRSGRGPRCVPRATGLCRPCATWRAQAWLPSVGLGQGGPGGARAGPHCGDDAPLARRTLNGPRPWEADSRSDAVVWCDGAAAGRQRTVRTDPSLPGSLGTPPEAAPGPASCARHRPRFQVRGLGVAKPRSRAQSAADTHPLAARPRLVPRLIPPGGAVAKPGPPNERLARSTRRPGPTTPKSCESPSQ
jgi:hypothetical protein